MLAGCSRHGQLAVRTLSRPMGCPKFAAMAGRLGGSGKLLNLAKLNENRADSLLAFMAVNPEIFKLISRRKSSK